MTTMAPLLAQMLKTHDSTGLKPIVLRPLNKEGIVSVVSNLPWSYRAIKTSAHRSNSEHRVQFNGLSMIIIFWAEYAHFRSKLCPSVCFFMMDFVLFRVDFLFVCCPKHQVY